RLQNVNLIGDLRAAQDHDERSGRILESIAKMLQFFFHQKTHSRFLYELCDSYCGRMRPVRRAKGIVHVKIAQLRKGPGKLWIVRFFTWLEPDILEQRDVAVFHVLNNFLWHIADCFMAENNRMMNERMQVLADWSK